VAFRAYSLAGLDGEKFLKWVCYNYQCARRTSEQNFMGENYQDQNRGAAHRDTRPTSAGRTGERRFAAAESVPVADAESKSLSESLEGSHSDRYFRMVRLLRGQNLRFFQFWSSPVTSGHLWSSLAKIDAYVLCLMCLFAAMNFCPCCPRSKTKSGKEKVKFR
jgi:hypothetical protein